MRVEYRLATTADAADIAAIYAPYVRDTAISFETEAPGVAEIASRIARIGEQYPWIVAVGDGRVVGYSYACEYRTRRAYRWSVDAAVYLAASAHRRGIGRALYERLFVLLVELGYANAFGGITLPNPASVALHESQGFVLTGVHRQPGYKSGGWPDVGWWQKVLQTPGGDPPAEPKAIGEIDAGRVAAILSGVQKDDTMAR